VGWQVLARFRKDEVEEKERAWKELTDHWRRMGMGGLQTAGKALFPDTFA
jgi:hypothetical protein